jgi:hypothetical protein
MEEYAGWARTLRRSVRPQDYMLPRDIEQKWMDMHERETDVGIPLD